MAAAAAASASAPAPAAAAAAAAATSSSFVSLAGRNGLSLVKEITRASDTLTGLRMVDIPLNTGNVPLRMAINALFRRYQPSQHSFWKALYHAPSEIMEDKTPNGFLAHFYLAYQGAMHATRTAVYGVPLHTPEERLQLAAVIVDDDNFITGESHHFHLESMFRTTMGIDPTGEFGDLKDLAARMDKELPASGSDVLAPLASHFVRRVDQLCTLHLLSLCAAHRLPPLLSLPLVPPPPPTPTCIPCLNLLCTCALLMRHVVVMGLLVGPEWVC
jgi:hypothetical protein